MDHTFIITADPGHAWVAVPASVLVGLDCVDKISPYSYWDERNATAYLEEDCDMWLFAEAYQAKHKHPPVFHTNHTKDTFIRDLPAFYAKHLSI